jgi:hypothetical protein
MSWLGTAETFKKSKFTPPSPIKATPTIIASNQDDVCPTSFSNADDIMLMSPSQSKDLHDCYSKYSYHYKSTLSKTTAVIAVMRGKP